MAGQYPSIPDPGADAQTQLATLRALKSAVELLVANTTGMKTASGVGANVQVFALAEEVGTLIKKEQTLRAAGDATSQDNLDAVEAAINVEVQSLNSDVAQAFSELDSISTTITQIQSNVANNSAAITTEAGVRATADTSLAGQITTLTATVNTNNTNLQASIQSEAVVRASQDSALAADISTVSTKADNNASAITQEASTRAGADTAIANDVTTLTATVNGHTTSISTQATAISTLNGYMAARYSVTLDVNGYVSGLSLLNAGSGTGSQFKILADRFVISYPGYSDKQAFVLAGGQIKFDGSIIASGTISASSIITNTINALGTVTVGYLSDNSDINAAKFLIDLANKTITISD